MTNDTEFTLQQLRQAIDNAAGQLQYAQQLFNTLTGAPDLSDHLQQRTSHLAEPTVQGNQQVLEGVFNGQNMVGADGKVYTVPANYASKSKLVEGDILKLTIRPDGSFIYKQIGPVERKRLVGRLTKDDHTGEYAVWVEDRVYKVIMAAVTYYKGQPGDEVVILTPPDGESQYAAVENLIHQAEADGVGQAAGSGGTEALLPDGSAAELLTGDQAELPAGQANA